MVETLLRLRRWKYLDVDLHCSLFRIRQRHLLFQVSRLHSMNFEIVVVNAANARAGDFQRRDRKRVYGFFSSRLISFIYGILWMFRKEDLFDKFLNRVDFSFE